MRTGLPTEEPGAGAGDAHGASSAAIVAHTVFPLPGQQMVWTQPGSANSVGLGPRAGSNAVQLPGLDDASGPVPPAVMSSSLQLQDEQQERSGAPEEAGPQQTQLQQFHAMGPVNGSATVAVPKADGSTSLDSSAATIRIDVVRNLWLATEEELQKADVAQQENSGEEGCDCNNCPICLEPLKVGNAVVTPCGHFFHHVCSRKSEEISIKSLGHWACPACRAPVSYIRTITTEDGEEKERKDSLPTTESPNQLTPILQRNETVAGVVLSLLKLEDFIVGTRISADALGDVADSADLSTEIPANEEEDSCKAAGAGDEEAGAPEAQRECVVDVATSPVALATDPENKDKLPALVSGLLDVNFLAPGEREGVDERLLEEAGVSVLGSLFHEGLFGCSGRPVQCVATSVRLCVELFDQRIASLFLYFQQNVFDAWFNAGARIGTARSLVADEEVRWRRAWACFFLLFVIGKLILVLALLMLN